MSPNTNAARLVVATILTAWTSAAIGDPPQPGAISLAFTGLRIVACDTKRQVEDIIEAGRESGGGMLKKYAEFAGLTDASGEPACFNGMLPPMKVVEVEDEGLARSSENVEMRTWAIRVAHDSAFLWIIYLEKPSTPDSPRTYERDGTVFGAG
jgi:hypothetical protein